MAKKPNKMTKIAVLDAAGVYQGEQEIPLADLTPDHVHLPDGCDLPPGEYKWDAAKKTFLPLRPDRQRAKEQPPVALNAVALGLIAGIEQGVKLPLETLAWVDAHIVTLDFMAPYSTETAAMIERYKNARLNRRNG